MIALSALAAVLAVAPTPGPPPPPDGDTLAAIRARGELRWGADSQGGAPYVFQDPMDPNHLIGFEVELAEALAAKLGVRARPVQGQWEALLELLGRGDFDVALNGIEVTEEKKRVCLLTRPYYAAPELLTVRRDDPGAPRAVLAPLVGRRIGTLPHSLAEQILRRAGAELRTYEGGQDQIFEDLRLGRTDGALTDLPIARYYGAIEPGLQVLDAPAGEVSYAIAVRPGDAALRDALDQALVALTADGTLRALYERWGIWNPQCAALLGDSRVESRAVPEAYDAWRAAVGKLPPFWERVRERYPRTLLLFARGAAVTLGLSVAAMALAVALGIALALARTHGPAPLRLVAVGYIEFVRGTPLLIQLTMIYFGLPELGLRLDPLLAGWLALGLNYAAAEAENYRAGLQSIPAGQREAASVLGLSTPQTLRFVLAPQALRVALPPMTNDFIALLKDSSLVSLVTVTELTKTYGNLASAMRDHLGLGAVVAAIYLLLGLPFAHLARRLEARLARHLRRAAS